MAQLRPREERRPRHRRDADLGDQPPREGHVVARAEARDVAEDVVGALGQARPKARQLERREQRVAPLPVAQGELAVVGGAQGQAGGHRLLQRCRRADGHEVMDLADPAGQLR